MPKLRIIDKELLIRRPNLSQLKVGSVTNGGREGRACPPLPDTKKGEQKMGKKRRGGKGKTEDKVKRRRKEKRRKKEKKKEKERT